ncbi:hypothetical protein MARPU_00985 [Marichromatium purpuratum 984]|uniref:Calcium-binding protein n=1 Tax=Marichromatium purpuratum 984 TaxID=765910 RepID=W0E3L0_MARPU|nr:calcium-binding protein [Marichromatium purpuratum]AHF05337.1 hypothetical protein MARPU_00985 [Marichromatium purpuratum 984]
MALQTFVQDYYLQQNPDVLQAILQGVFTSAEQHYTLYGEAEGRQPNPYFEPTGYYTQNPDVLAAVQAGTFSSALQHFEMYGATEGRQPGADTFNEATYLADNPDVQAAVDAGTFSSGYEHFVLYGADEGRDSGGSETPTSGETFTLTEGVDKATANVFDAPRAYTPGGTDQVNSLNDDDVLTGKGDNPTLNLTFVDDADTGNAVIAPVLNGIETINTDVVGTANKTLDLQDATGVNELNVSRINNTNYTTQNITSAVESFSLNNTNAPAGNVTFVHLASALSGDADETSLTLNNAQVNTLRVDAGTAGATTAGVGYETVNLESAGSANAVNNLSLEDVETLSISGDQNLVIGGLGNAAGSLSSIAAGELTGNLDINLDGVLSATQDGTSGTNIGLSTVTGAGDDTVRITNDTIGTTDSIEAGEGDDTLALQADTTNNFTPALTGDALVTGVENVSMTRTDDGLVADGADTLTLDLARIDGDQATRLFNNGQNDASGDGVATFNLNNASEGDAANISIQHSSSNNNALTDTVVNVDVEAGVDTVGMAIEEGVNDDPRFNFELNADSDGIVANSINNVSNIALADNDSESNTVELTQAARHTGTISVTGGTEGTFLNLDATAGGGATAGGYGHVLTGAAGDATTAAAAAAETRDTAVDRVFNSVTGDQVLTASNIDAADFAGNFEARLGVSNTNAQLGSGDDTLIFADRAGISSATTGLTIQDTVSGGEGYDTIILDGGAAPITLGASEWTNLSGVDEVRVAGQAGGNYTVRLTDQLVTQSDSGDTINVVNNDGDLTTNAENTLTVDTRALAASSSVTFTGANGDGSFALGARNAQTVILNDVTANGNNVLDGGDVNVVSEYVANGRNVSGGANATFATQAAADAQYVADVAAGTEGNNNVLQIFNTSEVTVGDLANTQNFSTINFTNDQAAVQTLNLTLDNATVDSLVDASHTATAEQVETLTITANDNAIVPGATSNLNVQAGTVGAQFSLNVTGDGGADVIVAGAGADIITGGGGADTLTGSAGNDSFVVAAGDSVESGAGNLDGDVITDFTSADDQIDLANVGAYSEADQSAAANYAAVVAAVDAAFTGGGAGNEDIYAAVDALGSGDTWVFVDTNADGSYTAGTDTFITLQGVNTLAGVDAADFV